MNSLLKQVKQLCGQHEAVAVDAVTVEIGPLSGVEAQLVREAFEELAEIQFTNCPLLQINDVPLQIRCRSCGRHSSVAGISLRCPECASSRVQIIRGDEFRLIDVAMQVPVAIEGE